MSEHIAIVQWESQGATFTDNRYSRGHRWEFDGGATVSASASPDVVPLPFSDPAAVDPEEAYVAALSSCHMLWFLSIAAKRGYRIESYRDRVVGSMAKNASGKVAVTTVTLHPHTVFSGGKPASAEDVRALHEAAHHECFLANSVLTEIKMEPTFEVV